MKNGAQLYAVWSKVKTLNVLTTASGNQGYWLRCSSAFRYLPL